MISTLLSELMPGPGTNKWGPDTRQTTPSIMVIQGINNLRAQLGGCIELSSHKTSVKCGHINTDTDQTTSGGMLNVDSNFGFIGMLSTSGGMLIASLGLLIASLGLLIASLGMLKASLGMLQC